MKEDQAKTKWCPMVRTMGYHNETSGESFTQTNRDHFEIITNSCCIASDCMMWRWTCYEPGAKFAEYVDGYCGLGGKP